MRLASLLAALCIARLHAYHHGARRCVADAARRRARAEARDSAARGRPASRATARKRNPDLLRKQIEERGNRVFDELVGEFPTLFTLKVVGADDNSFAADMVALIAEATGKSASSIQYSINSSSGGKYVSVTIQAPVASPDEVYECYAKLRGDPRVKMAL